MSETVLVKWVRAARAQAPRPVSSEALEQENKQLRVQLAGVKMERDILIFATDGPMKRFAFIALHAAHWPVRAQCRLLAVSPSGYYAWRKRAGGGRANACGLAGGRPAGLC